MRIIAGTFRGRRLATVGKTDSAEHLRPTTDRVRENLFNLLSSERISNRLANARVLDLFSGTGALAFEALSRGASSIWMVDNGAKSAAIVHKNIALFKTDAQVVFKKLDATRLAKCPVDAFDLIFLDPPYGKGLGEKALKIALERGWIAPEAYIVWEESCPMTAPTGFILFDQRKYGNTHVTILQRAVL